MTTIRSHLPAAALLGLLAAPAAFAQQAVIDRCKATSSAADRIACLEAALLGREAPVAPPAPAPVAEPEPAESRVDVPAAAPEAEPPEPVPAAESRVDPPEPAPSAPAAPVPDEAVVEEESEPTGIGAGQVIARTQTQEDRIANLERASGLPVERYDIVPYRKLLVTLANGQVWRQIGGDTQVLRVDLKRNQTVDIEETALGGYRMRLNEMRRTLRVERVR